jgi:hypothetical protein
LKRQKKIGIINYHVAEKVIKRRGMKMGRMNRLFLSIGLSGIFSGQLLAATVLACETNQVPPSVIQGNVHGGPDAGGPHAATRVSLSQREVWDVASQEGVGTAARSVLSSVVSSFKGGVSVSSHAQKNSVSPVPSAFKVYGAGELSPEAAMPAAGAKPMLVGMSALGREKNAQRVENSGSVRREALSITKDLKLFLGAGGIKSFGAVSVINQLAFGAKAIDSTRSGH